MGAASRINGISPRIPTGRTWGNVFDPYNLAGLTAKERAERLIEVDRAETESASTSTSAQHQHASPPSPVIVDEEVNGGRGTDSTDGTDGNGPPPEDSASIAAREEGAPTQQEQLTTANQTFPSLSTILCGVGCVASGIVATVAYFTDVFSDNVKDTIRFLSSSSFLATLGGAIFNAISVVDPNAKHVDSGD